MSGRGDKDYIEDTVNFRIDVYSDKYDQAADIADAIRFALEGWVLQDSSIRLTNITLTSANEDWITDAYEQSISFKAEVSGPITTDNS